MNEYFLRATGHLVVTVSVVTFVAAILLTHVSYAIAKRRRAATRYLTFMARWFLRRAVLVVFLLTTLATLLAIVPATALAWYRTRSFHQLADRLLVLRIHELNSTPGPDGGIPIAYEVAQTITNSLVIGELLHAIRFSPTYPNVGCLCSANELKYEISSVSRYGHEWPLVVFTVPHAENLRIWYDWYGNWHLSPSSQRDIAIWQKKYANHTSSGTPLIDAIPPGRSEFLPMSNTVYRLSSSIPHPGSPVDSAVLRALVTRTVSQTFVHRTGLRSLFSDQASSAVGGCAIHNAIAGGDELHVYVALGEDHITARYVIRTEKWLAEEKERRLARRDRSRRPSRRRRPTRPEGPHGEAEQPDGAVSQEPAPSVAP